MNTIRRTALIALTGLTLSLAGCAARQPLVFSKPGGVENSAEFRTDTYQCVQESRTHWSGGGSGLIGIGMMLSAKAEATERAKRLYMMCMGARGYDARPLQEGEVVQQ